MNIITLGMVTYKRHATFKIMLQSIINQTCPEWELVIINDGPDVLKKQIVESFNDPRIKYSETKEKMQGNASQIRNKCFESENSFLCAAVDDDDVLSPKYVETIKKHMNEKWDVLIFKLGQIGLSRKDNQNEYEIIIDNMMKKINEGITSLSYWEEIIKIRHFNYSKLYLSGATFVFRTEFLLKIGGWAGAGAYEREDVNTAIQFMKYQPDIKLIDDVLYFAIQNGLTSEHYNNIINWYDDINYHCRFYLPYSVEHFIKIAEYINNYNSNKIYDLGAGKCYIYEYLKNKKNYIPYDFSHQCIPVNNNIKYIYENIYVKTPSFKPNDVILLIDMLDCKKLSDIITLIKIIPDNCLIILTATNFKLTTLINTITDLTFIKENLLNEFPFLQQLYLFTYPSKYSSNIWERYVYGGIKHV